MVDAASMKAVAKMQTGRPTEAIGTPKAALEVRRFPYPYRAALAICSDLDETPDRHVYWEIMRFLNTTQTTAMGPGVGLEVGNTIYFDMAANQFAYWNTDDAGRAMVRALIRSGHIDCLHSYGDLATTRAHAGRALDELARHGCALQVWIDHSKAPTNFGADIMRGSGDLPESPAYHADLTCGFGVRYVCRGRVTSVTGQEVPARLGGIFTPAHPIASARTLGKETAKRWLARRGAGKYAIHGPNRVLRPETLRDGRAVLEMLRCNPHWGGVSAGDTAAGLGEVLTRPFLDRLVRREGACLLYTHMGKVRDAREPFDARTRAGLRLLAEYFRDGRLLVTTTRRLLGCVRAAREVEAEVRRTRDGSAIIEARQNAAAAARLGALAAEDCEGLTVYLDDARGCAARVMGRDMDTWVGNGADQTGRRSVSAAWRGRAFPAI